jgi:hypothetical protein
MVPVLCMLAAAPGWGCLRTPSLAAVDDALSKNTLSGADQTKAMALRERLADLLAQGNYRIARPVEAQIMEIIGLKLKRTRNWGSEITLFSPSGRETIQVSDLPAPLAMASGRNGSAESGQ